MVNKEHFIKIMAEKNNISASEARGICNMFLNALSEVLVECGDVKFNRFGKFEVKPTKERMARNPKTMEPVIIPSFKKIKFIASENLKGRCNK